MSFFEDASLVYIPSAVKTGKTYSIKPTDGSGDLTFTRNSTATRVNAEGLIESVAANVPRLDYTPTLGQSGGDGCPSLLLEPQRTQLFYDSTPRNFTTTSSLNRWVVGAGSPAVVNQAVGIFGTNSATKYTKTAGQTTSDFLYYNQAVVVSGSVYTLSGYVKLGTASNAVFVLNDSTAWNSVTGGTFVATAAGGYDEWKRFSITFTAPTSNRVNLHIGFHQESGLEAQATGTFFVEGLQLELGSYETSLIPSLGASVTRLADAAYKTGISSLIGQTEGTLYWEGSRPEGANETSAVSLSDGSTNNEVIFRFTAPDTVEFYLRSGGGQTVGSTYTGADLNQNTKIAFAYKANDVAIYVNGTAVVLDNTVTLPTSLTAFKFSRGNDGTPMIASVNQALLFKTRLTNAQLAELTTL